MFAQLCDSIKITGLHTLSGWIVCECYVYYISIKPLKIFQRHTDTLFLSEKLGNKIFTKFYVTSSFPYTFYLFVFISVLFLLLEV